MAKHEAPEAAGCVMSRFARCMDVSALIAPVQ
jgi:hypothetical protein